MDDVVSAVISSIADKFKNLLFLIIVKYSSVVAESSDVMDFMVFHANLNVYYDVVRNGIRCRHRTVADGFVCVFGIPDPSKFVP